MEENRMAPWRGRSPALAESAGGGGGVADGEDAAAAGLAGDGAGGRVEPAAAGIVYPGI